MVDEFFELITGENGFIVSLRCDNFFNEEKYNKIKNRLSVFVSDWKKDYKSSEKAMLAIVELMECLVGGSRFLSKNMSIKLEDASIEIKDILNELYETL